MSPKKSYVVGKGKPPKHTQWKPGQSGNPKGVPEGVRELAAVRALTVKEVVEFGSMILKGDVRKIKEIAGTAEKPSKESVLKVWMARVALRGISKGDAYSLDALLNRIVGKVKDTVELTGKDGGPLRSYMEMDPEARGALLRKISKRLEGKENEDAD